MTIANSLYWRLRRALRWGTLDVGYTNKLYCGDCVDVLRRLPSNSVDLGCTDPPYGINFMGKKWDRALPDKRAFTELYRVLKHGALAFVMSSPRQDVLWRMLHMLEDVGFGLRQSFISWIYKTGFPKAYDLSLGIDRKFIREEFIQEHGRKPTRDELKALLKEKRKVIGIKDNVHSWNAPDNTGQTYGKYGKSFEEVSKSVEPYHPSAKKWNGWKSITGLKPALECILMVNKPLSEKTIVDNVLKHGVGAINVDACRIPFQNESYSYPKGCGGSHGDGNIYGIAKDDMRKTPYESHQKGRFPANLLVSDGALDTGKITKSEGGKTTRPKEDKVGKWGFEDFKMQGYGDVGDQSRFFDLDKWAEHHGFLDVPKASKKERDEGCENIEPKSKCNIDKMGGSKYTMKTGSGNPRNVQYKNFHPTVKPVKLMAYLIELGCPPNGVVIDPFVGSGTTCLAAEQLNRKWIGIEINPEYIEIAQARIAHVTKRNIDVTFIGQSEVSKPSPAPSTPTAMKQPKKGTCLYEGECAYRNENGICTYKRYCKDRAK